MEKMAKNNDKNVHKGHRSRLKKEFLSGGLHNMPDHKALELLLFFGIPYKDTNSIAHNLIEHFGSFSGVLEADVADLVAINGMTENAACLIKMLLPINRKYIEDVASRKPFFTEMQDIVEFLRAKYAGIGKECVYALCFDQQKHLIACRLLNEGDISSSMFDLRKLAAVVLETNASFVIISHNHPHGITLPSKEDIDITERAYKLLVSLKVDLLDHIIVSETSYNSMINMPKFAHIFYGLRPLFPETDMD